MIDTTARLALRAYPPSFRERYGLELEALVEDTGTRPSVVVDLLVGALRAWLHPVMPDESAERRRRRMQASVATTWVTWCAALYALPMLRLILTDALWPTPKPARVLLDVAEYGVYGAGLITLVGAVALLAETSEAGDWTAWRPLVALVPTLAAYILGKCLVGLASMAPSLYWVGVVGLLGPAAFLIAVAVTPAVAVTRCRPSARVLRLLALTGVVMAVAVTMTGIACVAVIATLVMKHVDAVRLVTFPILTTTVAASATALVSAVRGVKAAFHGEQPVDLGDSV